MNDHMKGKNHDRLNYIALLPIIYFLGSHNFDIKSSLLFVVLWFIGTLFITPDLDTNSTPRKRLKGIGYIIDKLFKHRGFLHSPILWGCLGIVGYYYVGWEFSGLIIPQFLHIVSDWIS